MSKKVYECEKQMHSDASKDIKIEVSKQNDM